MPSLIVKSSSSLKKDMQQAAKAAGVKIDTNHFACAFSERASVANVAIKHPRPLTDAELQKGAELLFVHFDLPKGSVESKSRTKIANGFYIVRVSFSNKFTRGTATLLSQSNKKVGPFPMTVMSAKGGGGGPALPSIKLSGHISWCRAGVDAKTKKFLIEINIRWC